MLYAQQKALIQVASMFGHPVDAFPMTRQQMRVAENT